MIYWLEMIGTAVFAVSGALAASRKDMDVFGFAVLALMPAVGGGTLRDILIDRHPIFWISDTNYIYVAVLAAIATFFTAHIIGSRLRALIWMDAIGLALFAVLGSQIALEHGTSVPVAAIMGMITGVVGGMIRDVICNEVPLILSRRNLCDSGICSCRSISIGIGCRFERCVVDPTGHVCRFWHSRSGYRNESVIAGVQATRLSSWHADRAAPMRRPENRRKIDMRRPIFDLCLNRCSWRIFANVLFHRLQEVLNGE